MEYSDKIKTIQHMAGIAADEIAGSKTWIAIYHLLFDSVPYDLNVESIVKAVQQKIKVRVDGYASPKTWDALYDYVIENNVPSKHSSGVDPHNEIILKSMTKEVVPFAKELIHLAAAEGIYIRLMSNTADDAIDPLPEKRGIIAAQEGDGYTEFGLVFDIGIYEQTQNGNYIYKENSPLYTAVARLGESIGLTWAGARKTFSKLPHFELRPAWAVRMKENEMVQELCRRKKENINLLAIL
jgi:hypothetical protein